MCRWWRIGFFLNFIIKVRGGRHSTWEKHAVSKYSHLLSPRSHWQILPTSHLLTGLEVKNCTLLWALDFFDLFIVKTELKMEKYHHRVYLLISEVKSDCSHFVSKKCLQADLCVNCAYGRESKQRLLCTRWRGMCKKAEPIKDKATSSFTVNTCKCNRKRELWALVTWV